MSETNSPIQISFCLFAYNQESTIKEAVLCALNQICDGLEIILSDDCSTDHTFEIMQETVKDYRGPHKIILNRNPQNLGLCAHVNKVFYELSSGEWLVAAAGDDQSDPARCRHILDTAAQYSDARGFFCGFQRIDSQGHVLTTVIPKRPYLSEEKIDWGWGLMGATAAYHRDVIRKFPPLASYCKYEDTPLKFRALLCGSIYPIPDIDVKWLKSGKNMSDHKYKTKKEQIDFWFCTFQKNQLFSQMQRFSDLNVYMLANPEKQNFFSAVLACLHKEWHHTTSQIRFWKMLTGREQFRITPFFNIKQFLLFLRKLLSF